MAQSSAYCSSHQNSYKGEDKLAGGTFIKGSNRRILASAATRALTPAAAPVVALLAAFGSADSSVVRYLEDDF